MERPECSDEVFVDEYFNLNCKDEYCYVLILGVRERSSFNKTLDFMPKLLDKKPTRNIR